ncbi:MAG: hypothetical protein LC659_05870, partial [Myxococcales bacterium]|nr:hypothetical protein [Myxococcales bacterium]
MLSWRRLYPQRAAAKLAELQARVVARLLLYIARVKRLCVVLVLLMAMMSTSVVHARERRWSLFGGGLALFLAGWALDIGLSYGLGHQP